MSRVIRAMEADDFDRVAKIEQSVFSLPWSKKSIQEAAQTESNIYLVCLEDGQIAGYCGVWTVFGEGNITNVCVAPEFRQRGVAYALLKEMERIGVEREITIYFLEVRESNVHARHLYEKLGYQEIGMRKHFYERPVENAIVMSKTY